MGLNIALGYIAASLKKAGIEVKVLDMANHRNWIFEKMGRKAIEAFKPDLIGIPLFYINYYPVKEMISYVREFSDCPIVVGGPQMMIEKEQILEDIPGLDYAIIGDGEAAIVELCEAIQKKRDLPEIDGLVYRKGGRIVRNKDREPSKDIDTLPFPDYESFGIDKMRRYSILTSRGCAFRCTYCFRSTKVWRPRSPENIIEELKSAIEKYKIEEFVIVDDAFNVLPARVERLCDLLIQGGIKLPWSCSGIRADKVTDPLVKRMREAGCYSINVGVETLQPEIYAYLDRHMSMDEALKCFAILKKYGMNNVGYFMIGLPGETKAKTWDTYKKAKKAGIDYPRFSMLLPIPGTRMFDMIYSQPGTRRLEDYRKISTVWSFDPQFSRMKTAFDTTEYPAHEKIDMYNKLRTIEGDPRPPYHKNFIIFGLHGMIWILKYDPLRAPFIIYKLFKSLLKRFVKSKGKHVFVTENIYRDSFIREMENLLV